MIWVWFESACQKHLIHGNIKTRHLFGRRERIRTPRLVNVAISGGAAANTANVLGPPVLDRLAVSQIITATGEYVISIMNKRWSSLRGRAPPFGVPIDVCV